MVKVPPWHYYVMYRPWEGLNDDLSLSAQIMARKVLVNVIDVRLKPIMKQSKIFKGHKANMNVTINENVSNCLYSDRFGTEKIVSP